MSSPACPNPKSKDWLKIVNKTNPFEAYRVFVRNGLSVPKFIFENNRDVEKYLDFIPQLSKIRPSKKNNLTENRWYIPYGDSYATWLSNTSLVKKEVDRINNIYKGTLVLHSEPTSESVKVNTGRTKKEWITINPHAITEHYKIYQDPRELQKEIEDNGEMYIPNYEQRVSYNLAVTGALMQIKDVRQTIRLNDKANPYREQNLRKLLSGKGVSKEQIDFIFNYMKENDISSMNTEDLAIRLASEFAYTVESAVGKKDVGAKNISNLRHDPNAPGPYYFEITQIINDEPDVDYQFFDTEEEAIEWRRRQNAQPLGEAPSEYYSNLTVPGGTNYTENEIRTPDITPSIKGHAQFATDKGIGWFRSDDQLKESITTKIDQLEQIDAFIGLKPEQKQELETLRKQKGVKEYAKTRRILELQSDLFQRGRKADVLIGEVLEDEIKEAFTFEGNLYFLRDDGEYIRNIQSLHTDDPNKFQEITEEEYNFAKENTEDISNLLQKKQNKFLQLLNRDNNWVKFFINTIIQDSAKKGYEKVLFPKGETAAKVEGHETIADELKTINNNLESLRKTNISTLIEFTGDSYEEATKSVNDQIKALEQRKSELKSQGIEKLKPIEGFYEIRVGNILKKIDPNVATITDEYGNQWYQYTIKEDDISKAFALQRPDKSDKLSPENRKSFEKKKAKMLKTFPRVTEVIEDYNLAQSGVLESNGTIIKVNPDLWTTDTIGHEFGHLLIDLIGGLSNPLVKKARKQLIGSDIEAFVKERYPDLADNKDDRLDKEIIAQAIGEETAQPAWKQIINRILDRIKKILHIETNAARELARIVLSGESVNTDSKVNISFYEQRVADNIKERVNKKRKGKTEIEVLRDRALDALETKFTIYKRKDTKGKLDVLEATINQIKELDNDPIKGLGLFQDFAIEQTEQVYKRYILRKNEADAAKRGEARGKGFTLKELSRWRDYVSGFLLLEELARFAQSEQFELAKKDEGVSEVLNMDKLSEVIRKRDEIENAYKTEGVALVADFLAPYSKHLEAEFKESLEREYRELPEAEKANVTKDEYIQAQLAANKEDITKLTGDFIKKELVKASKDIGVLTRWVDNLLDSPDAVVSAMTSAFIETEHAARNEFLNVQDELVNKVRALEEFQSSQVGAFKDIRNLYDFMLEKDKNGNYTQNITSLYHSSMWDDYNKLKAELEKQELSYDRIQDELKEWKNENMPLNKFAFNKAINAFYFELREKGLLSKGEHSKLEHNNKVHFELRVNIEELVNEEAAEAIHDWIRENSWKFRLIANKYKNPQWLNLVKMAGGDVNATPEAQIKAVEENKTKDPRIDFYNFITRMNRVIQRGVPYSHRLHTRLPSVIKSGEERLVEGQGALNLLSHTLNSNLSVLADESERGERILTNEAGEPIHFIPVYYTTNLKKYYENQYDTLSEDKKKSISKEDYAAQKANENQSYDLGSIYARYFNSAIEYKHKQAILPEMEMARFLVNNRQAVSRDGKGNVIKLLSGKDAPAKTENLAAQLNDWFESLMYGMKEKDEGTLFGGRIDIAKAADLLNKYTALNMLGLNVVQGTANTILGSTMQFIESLGGQHYNVKDLAKANRFYGKNLPGIMGDIGSRKPKNIVSLLLRKFDILNEYHLGQFRKQSKLHQLLSTNTLFFTSHAGEHFMQTKVMLAMLNRLEAVDKNGKKLGSMLSQFSVENGKLILNKEVANFSTKEQALFEGRVRRVLSSLHGEYSQAGRIAIQRYALGRMGYMFRKFVVPGLKRRYQKKQINNALGEYVEGYYRTTGRFVSKLAKDLRNFQFAMMASDWNSMTDMERANIKKTVVELTFLMSATLLAGVLINMKEDADDEEEWFYSFLGYQMLRFKTELGFFLNPTEAMKILRSPAASMSVIENIVKIVGQMFPPDFEGFERYERGNWKGKYKINKTMVNFVPGLKQLYRMKYIDDQISWFN